VQWRHVYSCHRRRLTKAQGCSPNCVSPAACGLLAEKSGKATVNLIWTNPKQFPPAVNPLVYGGVPICLGYCPFHLGNEGLPASVRMRQFPRAEWNDHIHEELRELDTKLDTGHECPLKTTPCCPESAVGLQDLRYHLQDIHGVDAFYGPKRARRADGTGTSSKRARRDKVANGTRLVDKADDHSESSYFFVNLTPESPGACKPGSSNEMGTNSPPTIVEAKARPTPPYFVTLPTKSPEEREPEGPESPFTSSGLRAPSSDSPMLDSSSGRDAVTPQPSPCSDIADKIALASSLNQAILISTAWRHWILLVSIGSLNF